MYAHLRSIVLTRNDVEKTREVDDDGDDASASGGRIEKSLSAGEHRAFDLRNNRAV